MDVGETIPQFSLPIDGGGTVSTESLRGRKAVLYFYPKDDTSGCTAEAVAFRDAIAAFEEAGTLVVGISRDSLAKHEKFKAKHDLNFPLASDESGEVCGAFGVWVEKSMYGKRYMGIERATFLIGPDGQVRRVWRKVKVRGHAAEVIEAARSL